jgi:hypothetical protein
MLLSFCRIYLARVFGVGGLAICKFLICNWLIVCLAKTVTNKFGSNATSAVCRMRTGTAQPNLPDVIAKTERIAALRIAAAILFVLPKIY